MTSQQLPVRKVHAALSTLATEFSVKRFRQEIKFNLVVELNSGYSYDTEDRNFWDDVVRHASEGKAVLTAAQRPHLAIWIKENRFYLTENMSTRMKVEFNRRISELESQS